MSLSDIINAIKGLFEGGSYMSEKVDGKWTPIREYNPTPTPSRPSPTPTPSPRPKPTRIPTPVPKKLNDYERLTLETFRKLGIPEEVAYGIAAAENGYNNRFNLGAVDSNPSAAPIQPDLANATAAAKFLSGRLPVDEYGNGALGKKAFEEAYTKRDNPIDYLLAIMNAGFAGDPATWKERSIATGGAGQHYDTWDEFVRATPAWKKWSK